MCKFWVVPGQSLLVSTLHWCCLLPAALLPLETRSSGLLVLAWPVPIESTGVRRTLYGASMQA